MDWEQILNDILQQAKALSFNDCNQRKIIEENIELYGEKIFKNDKYTQKVKNINFWVFYDPHPHQAEIDAWKSGQDELCILIETMIKELHLSLADKKKEIHMGEKDKIFIVHGHDEALKYQVSDWLRSLELEPIILHLQASGGVKSIIDKIGKYSDVSSAIILMTSDDVGKAKSEADYKDRARQNVVFEAGYFIGKLGPERVIMLHENGVELPGDLGGCVYINANGQWKDDIRKEFNEMGIHYKT